jgi:hypothetical protein
MVERRIGLPITDAILTNKIYVIQSLPENERQTGEELYNDLIRWRTEQKGIYSEFIEADNRSEFHKALERVKDECLIGCYPLLHFEIHGYRTPKSLAGAFDGFYLKNGDTIGWVDFGRMLRPINTASKNNLSITLSVCGGTSMIMGIEDIQIPTPFTLFFGPNFEANSTTLLSRFTEFFDSFIEDHNFQKAHKRFEAIEEEPLPMEFAMYHSEEFFIKVACKLFESKFSLEQIRSIALAKAKKDGIHFSSLEAQAAYMIEIEIYSRLKTIDYFKLFQQKFFMLDLYPENSKRICYDWTRFWREVLIPHGITI